MALKGRRFELDPDAEDFTANLLDEDIDSPSRIGVLIQEIQERSPTAIPPPPKFNQSSTGFPSHRRRHNAVAASNAALQKSGISSGVSSGDRPNEAQIPIDVPPSDKAIAHHISRKYGHDPDAKEKADISEENKQRIAQMSESDIEEARSELMSTLSPAFIERLKKHTGFERPVAKQAQFEATSDLTKEPTPGSADITGAEPRSKPDETSDTPMPTEPTPSSSLHFPVPPRDPSTFVPLDPSSPTFLTDLKTHYFPSTPHDPSSLTWLQDPTPTDLSASAYNPTNQSYPPSSVRFSFTGRLIPPREALEIPTSQGLHHHGHDPSSAGYTIPELAILGRSTMPSQRCVCYQVLGRVLYRLGRGDFGGIGSELGEGLWECVERERVVEGLMREAGREKGGHVSARAYAVEALWLWRRGGGGERGLPMVGEEKEDDHQTGE